MFVVVWVFVVCLVVGFGFFFFVLPQQCFILGNLSPFSSYLLSSSFLVLSLSKSLLPTGCKEVRGSRTLLSADQNWTISVLKKEQNSGREHLWETTSCGGKVQVLSATSRHAHFSFCRWISHTARCRSAVVWHPLVLNSIHIPRSGFEESGT